MSGVYKNIKGVFIMKEIIEIFIDAFSIFKGVKKLFYAEFCVELGLLDGYTYWC